MNLSSTERDALAAGTYNIGLFIRLDVSPILRCWLGLGPIRVGVNALDSSGATYQGFGELLNYPAVQQLINGAAERVEISLSGTNDRILELATERDNIKGVACDLGFGALGADWSLLGDVHWMRHFVADYLALSVSPAGDPNGQTVKTAVLSIGSLMTGRRRAGRSYFNNQDQQARDLILNPDGTPDLFCERTPAYSLAGNKQWPRY